MKKLLLILMWASAFYQPAAVADLSTVSKFVVIWEGYAEQHPDFKKHIQAQSQATLKMWREGTIENAYMYRDNSSGAMPKKGSRFVFFIKANSKKEVDQKLADMPFVKHKVATYKTYPVGFLWLGAQPKEY